MKKFSKICLIIVAVLGEWDYCSAASPLCLAEALGQSDAWRKEENWMRATGISGHMNFTILRMKKTQRMTGEQTTMQKFIPMRQPA